MSITYLYMQSCFIKGYSYGEDEDISWFNADIYMIDVKNQVLSVYVNILQIILFSNYVNSRKLNQK